MQLHPISAGVDVTAVGIAIDQTAAGSEVTSAVIFMKPQGWKLEQIDLLAL